VEEKFFDDMFQEGVDASQAPVFSGTEADGSGQRKEGPFFLKQLVMDQLIAFIAQS